MPRRSSQEPDVFGLQDLVDPTRDGPNDRLAHVPEQLVACLVFSHQAFTLFAHRMFGSPRQLTRQFMQTATDSIRICSSRPELRVRTGRLT